MLFVNLCLIVFKHILFILLIAFTLLYFVGMVFLNGIEGGWMMAAAFAEPEDFPLFCVRSANRTAKCRLVRYLNHKEQKNIKTDYHA